MSMAIIYGGYLYVASAISTGLSIFSNSENRFLNGLPVWLYFVEYFIFVFIILAINFLIMTRLYSILKEKAEEKQNLNLDFFIMHLSDFLYGIKNFTEKDKTRILRLYKKSLNPKDEKKDFLDFLKKVHTLTIGPIRNNTSKILIRLKYDGFLRAYLHSPYLKDKIFAIQVISDFQLPGYNEQILKLANKKKNQILRSEALEAMIKLNINDNLSFLAENNFDLSLWDINLIIKIVEQHNIHTIDYSKLINSNNESIITLGLLLIRLHNRTEFKAIIQKIIEDSKGKANEEAFFTLAAFAEDRTNYKFLMENYNKANEKAQLSIVRCLTSNSDIESTTLFLDNIIEKEPLTYKIEAVKVLFELDFNNALRYNKTDNTQIKQAWLEVLDINT